MKEKRKEHVSYVKGYLSMKKCRFVIADKTKWLRVQLELLQQFCLNTDRI